MSDDYNLEDEFSSPEQALHRIHTANFLILEQRRRALADMTIEILSTRPVVEHEPVDSHDLQLEFQERLLALERRYCNDLLAHYADKDMGTASQMKRLIEHLWPSHD